ncbi:MAG: hypothetical protein JO269_11250 [Burkholderiaceae bacterium]|nr:hypothetical protein [Burkholderiaceae bacterium]
MNEELENVLALHLVGARLSHQPTHAVEARKYSRPASDGVRFASEDAKSDAALRTKDIENILHHDIENWMRWGRRRDWLPMSFRCPLGFLYRASEVRHASFRRPPCDELEAARFERIVVSLPERHRQAFVMHHLDKAHVNNHVVIVSGRDDKARLLGVQKSRYHELVRQAHHVVLRGLRKKPGRDFD